MKKLQPYFVFKSTIALVIALLCSSISLSGKEPNGYRDFPLVSLKDNELSQFMKDIIVPLAKSNNYDPMSDKIELRIFKTDKGYKARIIVDICFDLYPVYDKDNTYYLSKIDGVLIFIGGDAARMILGDRLGYIRAYSKPLLLAVCDDEAQWTFVNEENTIKFVCFEDWGLTWLEGVPREFYDPGFVPVKKLEPNMPECIDPRSIPEAPSTCLPIRQ